MAPSPALPPGWQQPDHIVIVDDDPAIRTLLSRILREVGYDASGAESAAELERIMAERAVSLVLLDIMMPGMDGLSLCRAIRARSKVPVIMISARGGEADRVAGLDVGADDYIAKPFGRPEVLARIRAVLRRSGDLHLPLDVPAPEYFAFGGWRYRPRRRELLASSGAEVELTGAEHELLLTLLRHPQRMIGRERLLELARSRLSHSSDRSVDVLISRLRRKMGDGRRGGRRPMIRTIRGVGYMMAVDVEAG
ncbi:response regulator transcription factor [Sphingomonas flavalba]|uniref:response regulator transcription factor n=1 Tax=Sphingomonas flavalba TaxID=2559804 RepID=UPI00109DCEE2|nr:response regulator transcription factor [Sphingomonas flavalba]